MSNLTPEVAAFVAAHPPAVSDDELAVRRAALEAQVARMQAAEGPSDRALPRPRLSDAGQRAFLDALDAKRREYRAQVLAERAAFDGDCLHCRDRGPCARCARGRAELERARLAADEQRIARWQERTGIPQRSRGWKFATYPARHAGLAAVADFVRAGGTRKWLVLHGPYGTGKTGLVLAALNATANAWSLSDLTARFVTSPDLYGAIKRDGFDDTPFRAVDLLVIDDLGVARQTGWADEVLFAILSDRLAHERATWFTTNLDPDGIKTELGERLYWRLIEAAEFIALDGPNLRLEKGISA